MNALNLRIPSKILHKQLHALCLTSGNPTTLHLSSLIKYYHSKGAYILSLLLYTQVVLDRIQQPFFPMVLKACASLSLLPLGRSLHADSIKAGQDSDVMVGTALISLYWKCHDLADARQVFDGMSERNAVTYNAMISGYLENGDMRSASVLFDQMLDRTPVSWMLMIEGLARAKDTVSARWLFDQMPFRMKTVETWTAMVHAYTINGEMDAARRLFDEMPCRNFFVWSLMVAGYFKKGDVEEGRALFYQIPTRNSVHWNALIAGYAQNGCCNEALEAVAQMMGDGHEPDEITVVSALSACAQLGSLETGRKIHELIEKKGITMNKFVLCGLVDMYAKCGDLEEATKIFQRMERRNRTCWNSMISGYANHGRCRETLELFAEMELEEKPDNITFLVVLSACTHGGYVKEGFEIFNKMKVYGLVPEIGHYGCLVDLLGRAGRLNEAYILIQKIPVKPNDVILGCFLGACKIHSDAHMAERLINEFNVDFGGKDADRVTLSNIYAVSERWEEAERMRRIGKYGNRKCPGYSSVISENSEKLFDNGIHSI